MTLIELMIVVFILLLVAVAAVQRLQPMMDHSKIREAARATQLYLSSARNQAIASGRSVGVLIEPLPADNGCSMTLKMVETPVPYGGDSLGCTATASFTSWNNNFANCTIALSSPTSVPIHPSDLIQVGYQGFWLMAYDPSNPNAILPPGTTQIKAQLDCTHGETPAWLYQPITGPYKILRWPVKSGAADMQLPSPTVIDLTWSGNDPVSSTASPTWNIQTPPAAAPTLPTPVIIMFAADGRIDWVSNYGNPGGIQVMTPVYLMVGTRNKVFDNHSDPNIANTNLNDLNSLWVSIDAATGLIIVADPAAVPPNPASIMIPQDVNNSRAFARQASANVGGK